MTTLKTMIYQLMRIINAHVKAGGNAHLPANERRGGFMSAEMWRDNQRFGKTLPKTVTKDNPIGIEELGNGFWIVEPGRITGMPTEITGISYIDVSRNSTYSQRSYEVIESFTGKRWVKEFHTNLTTANIPIGWRRIYSETLLYTNTGTASPEGTVMKLSESIGTFDSLKFVYSYEGMSGKIQYMKNVGNLTLRDTNMPNDGVLTALTHAEMLIQRFKMLELTVSVNKAVSITGDAKNTYHNSAIKIEEIWGIK